MKTALLVGAVTPISLAPRTALLQFSRDVQHQSLGPCSRSLHQCCSVKQDENSLACRCSHTYKFGTSHSSAELQQHQSLGHCSRSLHHCCSVKQEENSLACRCSHTYKFGTSHSSAELQQHQSLGHCSRSLHHCCSVKQEENSLACRCNHSYKFGTSHSSAAIQQRCAAPKPGTLFTLTAPVLLCEAR